MKNNDLQIISKSDFLKMSHDEKLNIIHGTNKKEPQPEPKNKNENEQIRSLQRQIRAIEEEARRTKTTFEEIAKNCPLEWFRPEWMKRPAADKVREIKYWLS